MLKKTNIFSFILGLTTMLANLNSRSDPGTDNLNHSWTFNDGTANDNIGGAGGILTGNAEIIDGSLVIAVQESWMELPADIIVINTSNEVIAEIWFTPIADVWIQVTRFLTEAWCC